MACWLSYLNDRLDSSGSPPCLMGKMLKLRFLSFFFPGHFGRNHKAYRGLISNVLPSQNDDKGGGKKTVRRGLAYKISELKRS